jgi:hypothetical protein
VIELNGAVDFDVEYTLPGRDVYSAVATALGLLPPPRLRDLRRTVVVR